MMREWLMEPMNVVWLAAGIQVAVLVWGAVGLIRHRNKKPPQTPDWEAHAEDRKRSGWRPLPHN